MFTAGYNMPGYMPEVGPVDFHSLSNAKTYIMVELTEAWEAQYQKNDIDHKNIDENYRQLIEQVNHTEETPFSVYDDYTGYVFWVHATEDGKE